MDYEDRIRERAHRIWEEEGRPHGRHEEHWHRACREVGAQSADSRGKPGEAGLANRGTDSGRAGQRPSTPPTAALDPTALQSASTLDDAGSPDQIGVDEVGVGADRITPADNRPAGSLPKRILP